MNRRRRSYSRYYQFPFKPSLIICAAALLCGLIAGAVEAGLADGGERFTEDVYMSLCREGEGFAGFLLNNLKFLIAVVFLSSSILGVALIPVLCAVRGFLLAFSVASAARAFSSFSLVLSAFGVPALIALPCFVIISTQAFIMAALLLKASKGISEGVKQSVFLRQYAASCLISGLTVIVGSAFEAFVLNNITVTILQKLFL